MSGLSSLPPEQQLGRAPLPVQYEMTGVSSPDGTVLAVLEMRTPSGESTYFLPVDLAQTMHADLGSLLVRISGAGAGGLVVPAPRINMEALRRDLNGGQG